MSVKNESGGSRQVHLNKIQRKSEDANAFYFSSMMYIMHEYGHYGDKETNSGLLSGQRPVDNPGLPRSPDNTLPIQFATSASGHRGSDVDNAILFGGLRSDIPFATGYNGQIDWDVIKLIKDSNAYKTWLLNK